MAEDVRRRRAERVRKGRLKRALPRYGKYVLLVVVIVAAIAAAATFVKLPAGKRFVHEHASFALFIEGERVSFVHTDYDLRRTGAMESHMHVPDSPADATGAGIHFEASFTGGVPDITMARFFQSVGITFRQGFLKLDTFDNHNGSEWPDRGEKTWRVYVSEVTAEGRGPFTQVPGDYAQFTPNDGDKVHVTYGDDVLLTPQELARQQAQIPEPPGFASPAGRPGG